MAISKIPVLLSDNAICYFEIENISSGRQPVSAISKVFDLSGVKSQVRMVSEEFVSIFNQINVKKTTIEFGIELSVESGQLTSIIVKGAGKANLKVTLEWENNA